MYQTILDSIVSLADNYLKQIPDVKIVDIKLSVYSAILIYTDDDLGKWVTLPNDMGDKIEEEAIDILSKKYLK